MVKNQMSNFLNEIAYFMEFKKREEITVPREVPMSEKLGNYFLKEDTEHSKKYYVSGILCSNYTVYRTNKAPEIFIGEPLYEQTVLGDCVGVDLSSHVKPKQTWIDRAVEVNKLIFPYKIR